MTASTQAHHGKLICFCGIDGSGKSTHSQFVAHELKKQGYSVKRTVLLTKQSYFFQCMNPFIGRITDQFYCDLFGFQRYMSAKSRLCRELETYDVVLCDRYLFTDIAYTIGYQCDPTNIKLLLELAPKPDLVLLFDVNPEVALERISKRGKKIWKRQENLQLLTPTRLAYLDLAKEMGFKVIDSHCSLHETQEAALKQTVSILADRQVVSP